MSGGLEHCARLCTRCFIESCLVIADWDEPATDDTAEVLFDEESEQAGMDQLPDEPAAVVVDDDDDDDAFLYGEDDKPAAAKPTASDNKVR